MRILLLAACGLAAWAAEGPRVVYTKSFPGSAPPFVAITVEQNGAAAYRESASEDDAETFRLEPSAAAAIFDLAARLDHFKRPIESGMKVANLGAKTFRWEDGGQATEAKFNYSLDENAKALQDWFERITESERAFVELRIAAQHDKLGVNDALLHIQTLWDQKRLVAATQFLPLLDRIAAGEAYINMARSRAAALAEALRAPGKAKLE